MISSWYKKCTFLHYTSVFVLLWRFYYKKILCLLLLYYLAPLIRGSRLSYAVDLNYALSILSFDIIVSKMGGKAFKWSLGLPITTSLCFISLFQDSSLSRQLGLILFGRIYICEYIRNIFHVVPDLKRVVFSLVFMFAYSFMSLYYALKNVSW